MFLLSSLKTKRSENSMLLSLSAGETPILMGFAECSEI